MSHISSFDLSSVAVREAPIPKIFLWISTCVGKAVAVNPVKL